MNTMEISKNGYKFILMFNSENMQWEVMITNPLKGFNEDEINRYKEALEDLQFALKTLNPIAA